MKKIAKQIMTADDYKKNGLQKMNSCEFKAAITNFSAALKIEPNNHDIYRLRATAKCYSYKFCEASADYSKALMIDPFDANLYLARGIARESTSSNHKAGFADFNKSIELCPTNYIAYYFRGMTNYYLNDYNAALSDFNIYIEYCPDFIAFYKKNVKKIKFAFRHSYKAGNENYLAYIAPSGFDVYFFKGYCNFLLGNISDALVDVTNAIACEPKNIDCYNLSARIKYSLGNYEAALEDCNKAIDLYFFDWEANELSGDISFKLGHLRLALFYYNLLLKPDTKECDIYVKRGKIKHALNDLLGAFNDFKSAVEIDPNDKNTLSLKEKTETELIKFLES